ncbi:hypothetical protein EGH21_14010 [Halomicroarcula sp. F13]|uniref:Uncharacterized protein n=1 Tax=Haloarcula rubra TaxID=2487747 RepID=A0AAW4PUV3_9EURY|nr:hypothetical protein [Halomicroarcula rubra]MBX0324148.1 hypothetical protein [Halomicroarcula rubra]
MRFTPLGPRRPPWTTSPFGVAVSFGALLYLAGSLVFVPESDGASDGDDGPADRSESGT